MKKGILIILPLLLLFGRLTAQNSLSFYHLGNATFQNGTLNPAFVPEGQVFVGLPVLSGIHVNYNNRFNYNELISINPETDNPKIDLKKALKHMGQANMISTNVNISLLHFAVRAENGSAFSIFANERIESDILFDRKVMKFAINGNSSVIDQKIEVGRTRAAISHFREIGIGVAYPSPSVDVVLGAHIKYLQGFLNYSTPENQSAYVSTNGKTYILNGDFSNAMLRSSGIRIAKGNTGDYSHFGFNNNHGMAIDLGFNWEMNKYNSIAVSLNDLGFISWKDDVKNYQLTDTSFNYSGVGLNKIGNLEKSVKDSLLDKFELSRTYEAYNTLVGPRLYASWTYHTPYEGGDVVTSLATRYVQKRMKTLLGVGYRQRFGNYFVGSLNVTKMPQQFFNLGTAVAVKGGPAQFYLAVDQLYNFDATKFQAIDFRVGINFIFGAREDELQSRGSSTTFSNQGGGQTKRKGAGYKGTQSFMGEEVEVKKQEGIYNIIPKQQRRKKEEYMSAPPK